MRVEERGPIRLLDLEPPVQDFRGEVLRGLCRTPKKLPCKFFYDAAGAALFERICELEEYYPTRTETEILARHLDELCALCGEECLLVELGSGNSSKTRRLLDHLRAPAGYVPIDISQAQLVQTARALQEDYPWLEVLPVCADYQHRLGWPSPAAPPRHTVVFFPGSTIGNFEPDEAADFLQRLAGLCAPGDHLLVGADLHKDVCRLEAAYNDAAGVTAAFNLNLLRRINRELEADFDLRRFRHRAIYNQSFRRIEMHLVSLRRQSVRLGPTRIAFGEGEAITTEYSYKYTVPGFGRLARRAGLEVERVWTDPRQFFGMFYLSVNGR